MRVSLSLVSSSFFCRSLSRSSLTGRSHGGDEERRRWWRGEDEEEDEDEDEDEDEVVVR